MTRKEREHLMYGMDAIDMMERDILQYAIDRKGIPRGWANIWHTRHKRDTKRTRCTVAFDADVVKFFKAIGPGYQARMNTVLRTYMHFRLAKVIEGPGTCDFVVRPKQVQDIAREADVQWGDANRTLNGGSHQLY